MHSASITKRCCLTGRSTGPIAAGRHLGFKSLAQIPTRRNRPVSSNVRHQLWNSANFVNTARQRRLASQIQLTLRQVSEATLHNFENYCVQCLSVHPHKLFPPALMHSPSITKRCCLTIRSTGPIAAGRHLGYKSLAQMPAHRNRPVTSNVRHHLENTKYIIKPARRDASPLKFRSQSR